MIITRTPLRISFVGGGSDLPWFYNEEPGACVTAAIDKYVYVTYSPKYEGTFRAAYSQMETVDNAADFKHELIRETLLATNNVFSGREIHSIADIPGGTGLGSSSAFTVGLLRSMYPNLVPVDLAMAAIGVEIDRCGKAIGVQDQMTGALGGIHIFGFGPKVEGHVLPARILAIECEYQQLSDHLLLFDTGMRRNKDASTLLVAQQQNRDEVRQLAAMAEPFAKALVAGEMKMCGTIMDDAWGIKRGFVANDKVNDWYRNAKWEGAWGGKLCGAGGGGFMLFMAPPQAHSRIEKVLGLRRVPIKVGVEGSKVIYSD